MSLEYNRILTDMEVRFLEHDLSDIKDWIDKAIDGKINNCVKRASKQYEELAKIEAIKTVPTSDLDKANLLFESTQYKTRLQRETENGN